jgi:hypothetical protein
VSISFINLGELDRRAHNGGIRSWGAFARSCSSDHVRALVGESVLLTKIASL